MPVKVRCPGCEKVLNVPDTARGKSVRCPKCETKIPVPAGEAEPVAQTKKSATKRKANSEDALAALDLSRMEDTSARLCPKCGAELDAEAFECPVCGADATTGGMGRTAKRRQFLGGMPDPNDFYKNYLRESKEFLRENMGLAWRTGLYWTIFAVLSISAFGMFLYSEKTPPKVFWASLAVILSLGLPGWYWFLSQEIIRATLEKKKKLKRVGFDFFQTVAMGVKSYIWPIVVSLPFPPIYVLTGLFLPLALIHMTQRYPHKAWLPFDLLRLLGRNFGQVAVLFLTGFVLMLPVIGAAVAIGLFNAAVVGWLFSLMDKAANSIAGTEPGLWRDMMRGMVGFLLLWTFFWPVATLAAFPSVFLMRANGSLAHYCRKNLELMMLAPGGQPCGFWVRWLAFLADAVMIGLMLAILWGLVYGLSWVVIYMGLTYFAYVFYVVGLALSFGIPWFYFAKQESSTVQATLGKRSLGIVVTDLKGKRIKLRPATIRFVVKLFSIALAGIGCVMAAFTPKKQAMHDSVAKTLVVWRGGEEA